MKKKFLLFINLLALLFAWQVSHIKQVAADDKIKVVTTFILSMSSPKLSQEIQPMCRC